MEHHFEPQAFHHTFGTHEPVLRVASGDRIVTTTLDAHGRDAADEPRSRPANPQTGPFYVEGAEPGDALAVHLDRIEPNRDHGFTRAPLAPGVVDPAFVAELGERTLVHWRVDRASRFATLDLEGHTPPRLGVPLAPMLGCIGVAPDGGEAISTVTSGRHGGNMDYRGIAPGVTVLLPVFVPGALLHVGDGHAVQGEGEIVGTGVEISMDVEVTVEVRKGQRIGWPRAESETHLMALGNARPLDQALQHATTEMMRWLCTDHGFDAMTASHLLGQCVEYDVGNVFDPAYTVVCKVPKHLMP